MKLSTVDRFNRHVNKSGNCWIWTKSASPYGKISVALIIIEQNSILKRHLRFAGAQRLAISMATSRVTLVLLAP